MAMVKGSWARKRKATNQAICIMMQGGNMSQESTPSSSLGPNIPLPARVVVSLKAGAMLAIANIFCAAILSYAWVHSHTEAKVLSVTGSAKKTMQSDLIVWNAKITADDPQLA